MALGRGMAAVKTAKDKSGGNFSGLREVFLSEGQSMLVRIWGDFENEEDPVVFTQHYVKRLDKKLRYQMCGANNDQPCVFCHVRDELGDKGISASSKGAILLYDYARYHKLEREVRSLKAGAPKPRPGTTIGEEHYVKTKYPTCTGKNCVWCREGNAPHDRGWSWMSLSVMHLESLLERQKQCREFCKCGHTDEDGQGTLQGSHICAACGSGKLAYNADSGVARCRDCGHKAAPAEVLECPNCETPQRCDVQDFKIRITRVGSDKTTSYLFDLVGGPRPPTSEELENYEKNKPDWTKMLGALSPTKQAAALGVPLPDHMEPDADAADTGSVNYDDEDDFYNTDVTPAPVKTKTTFRIPVTGRTQTAKPNVAAKPGIKRLVLKRK